MCGIAGILKVWTPEQRELALRTPHGRSVPEQWLDILDDSIKHRGPDGHGRFRDRAIRADGCVVDVALVHRRLSIIDHAGGHQPMVHFRGTGILPVSEVERHNARVLNTDWSDAAARPESHHGQDARATNHGQDAHATDRIAVVFNGCIYNHRELRAELQRAGHVFNTDHSDTEVLVHGLREWQRIAESVATPTGNMPFPEFYGKLDGMYAIALWDGLHGVLSLARDRCGEKPLYSLEHLVGKGAEVRAFSSAMPGLCRLRAALGGDLRVDTSRGSASKHWIRFGFSHGSLLEGIEEVDRGSDVSYPEGVHGPMAFSAKVFAGGGSNQPLNELRLDSILASAVESRLEADVALGCFLSGGVDSSLVAHYAKRSLGRLNTFTVRMPHQDFDESRFASAVARHLGTTHSTLDCDPAPSVDLANLIQQLGLPFGDSSLLPAYWLSRAARQHVRVSLSGDGGDELFMGYDRYKAASWLEALGPFLNVAGWLPSRSNNPRSRWSRFSRLGAAACADGYDDLLAIFPASDYRHLIGDRRAILPAAQRRFKSRTGESAARSRAMEDLYSYLPDDLLRKTDSASMSVALEVRAPLLADRVVFAACAASERELLPRGQRKGLLRQVARKYLPAEIVDRPKMGFAIPIGEWFRSDYGGLRTMLLDHLNSTEPFGPPSLGIDLNRKFIRQMLDEHLGTGPSGQVKRDHSQRLYMLLVLSIWAKWMGGLSSAPRPG